jgi:undecaprenyl-diphosphatase
MRDRIRQLLQYSDFLALILLAIIVGTLWAFVELADELSEGELHEIDLRLLYLLRDPADPTDPLGPSWFEELVRDASALGGVFLVTLLCVAVIGTLWLERRRLAALWLTVAVIGAFGISTLLKNIFERDRPDLLAGELLPASYSFPSGHSFFAAAVYLTIGALLTRVFPDFRTKTFVLSLAVLLVLLVGFSRVYLGVHYPSDVLAGWTLGSCWAAICWLVVWYRQKLR